MKKVFFFFLGGGGEIGAIPIDEKMRETCWRWFGDTPMLCVLNLGLLRNMFIKGSSRNANTKINKWNYQER